MVRLAAGPAGGKYRVVRDNMSEVLQFGLIFDKDGRGVESDPAVQMRHRWMLAKAKERDASRTSRPRSERLQRKVKEYHDWQEQSSQV